MTRDADNPAAVYRESLSRGSYWAVHHSLETIVKVLVSRIAPMEPPMIGVMEPPGSGRFEDLERLVFTA